MVGRSPRTCRILILASDAPMRTALCEALERAGFFVGTARDLGEGVDRLREIQPDLLIVRPYINSMPGDQAADYLRSRRPGLAVLMISGFVEDDRVLIRGKVGKYHMFPKPFTPDELVSTVCWVLKIAAPEKAASAKR